MDKIQNYDYYTLHFMLDDLLVLFDQHAADERVRLEALTEGLLACNNIGPSIV